MEVVDRGYSVRFLPGEHVSAIVISPEDEYITVYYTDTTGVQGSQRFSTIVSLKKIQTGKLG